MKFHKLLTLTLSAAFIAACGGGGGDAGVPAPTPVVSADIFQVKTAYINYFNDTATYPFTISGTVSGYSVSGSGSLAQSSVTGGTFEGAAALQETSTVNWSLMINGQSSTFTDTQTAYVDSTYVPLGWAGDEYVMVTSAATIPVTAMVNDKGIWHTANRYATSAKTTLLGTEVTSFELAPDTAVTALLKITQVDKDTLGNIEMTATATFRMTPAGALTRLSENAVDATTSLTLTY